MTPSPVRRRLRTAALVSAALLGLASLASLASSPASADPVEPTEITLISVNDLHGIDANTVAFAGTVEKLRADHGETSTLFLSAGDVIEGTGPQTPESLDPRPFEVLNALDLGASAVGNHDFHNGVSTLTTTIPTIASFPFLSANILKSNARVFPAYKFFDVAGLKIAVIGATTRTSTLLDTRLLLNGLKFIQPVDAVNETATELKAMPDPPDIIVAVYHEGGAIATENEFKNLATGWFNSDVASVVYSTSSDVDVVFTGHTHKTYAWAGPVPGEPGRTRPVLQTGSHGDGVSEVVLSIDPNTNKVLSYTKANVGRSTLSDAELVATYPRVAEVNAIVHPD